MNAVLPPSDTSDAAVDAAAVDVPTDPLSASATIDTTRNAQAAAADEPAIEHAAPSAVPQTAVPTETAPIVALEQ
jgi:hypothetical protein